MKNSLEASLTMIVVTLLIALTFTEQTHAAGVFSIKNRATGLDRANAAELAIYESFSSIADGLETTVNDGVLSESLRSALTTSFAKTGASSASSTIVDRSSNFSVTSVTFGGQYNSEGALFSNTANTLPTTGIGAQGSVTIGIKANKLGIGSIGPIQGSRLNLYARQRRNSRDD